MSCSGCAANFFFSRNDVVDESPNPQVEEGLFRSGQPSSINLRFLSELNLKTIVWLGLYRAFLGLELLVLFAVVPLLRSTVLSQVPPSLAVEEPNESLLAFADDNELTIHHLGIAEGLLGNRCSFPLLALPMMTQTHMLLQVEIHGIP